MALALRSDLVSVVDEVRAFVASGQSDPEAFEPLALSAFAYQYERVPAYRALAERAGRTPATVHSWQQIPAVPAAAFAHVDFATDPPLETFRSCPAHDGRRNVHLHPFPDLYRAVVDATFPRYVLPRGGRPPMLALVPPRADAPDSALGFMIAHVLERYGGGGSRYGYGARGVDTTACRAWFTVSQREGKPVLILATGFALAELVERLERIHVRHRLPAGSAVFETGGFTGRTRVASRAQLVEALETQLGVPADRVVSEYGRTELTSQAYTETLVGRDGRLFVPPPWLRVRALDPETLDEVPAGSTGLLAFLDLANVGSALHVLTEDLGSVEPGGFRLAGRAPEERRKGASVLVEELTRP
jgi:hypothetical protein